MSGFESLLRHIQSFRPFPCIWPSFRVVSDAPNDAQRTPTNDSARDTRVHPCVHPEVISRLGIAPSVPARKKQDTCVASTSKSRLAMPPRTCSRKRSPLVSPASRSELLTTIPLHEHRAAARRHARYIVGDWPSSQHNLTLSAPGRSLARDAQAACCTDLVAPRLRVPRRALRRLMVFSTSTMIHATAATAMISSQVRASIGAVPNRSFIGDQ